MAERAMRRVTLLLAIAAFASIATMRVADSLLPQIAAEFRVGAGDAAIVSTAFTIAYGFAQFVYGPLGDRFGKVRLVALMTVISALTTTAGGLAGNLALLGAARLASGATVAAIVPLSLAFIGDHVAYEGRQVVLARFLSGTIIGVIFGQALGGVIGEFLGWRAVFPLLGAVFLIVGSLLLVELQRGRLPPAERAAALSLRSLASGYGRLLGRPWARVILVTVFVEGFIFYGAFTYVGADLHQRFAINYGTVGLVLSAMGLGGLAYALTVRRLVRRLGERGLAVWGAALVALGLVAIAAGPFRLMAPAIAMLGLGLYMLHGTLQTNATQMAPEARGLAVSTFANALFVGQAIGIWVAGLMVDRIGFAPIFLAAAAGLLVLGLCFGALLSRRPAET
jgi:predicted MFS family arabinose efflux permease